MADGDGAQGDLLSGDKGGAAGGEGGDKGAAGGNAGAADKGAAAAAAKPVDGAAAAAVAAAAKGAGDGDKGAGDDKGKGDAGKDGGDKGADAPIDYTALKMPEGIKADDPVLADALKLFGEKKITPEVAQDLINFTAERDKLLMKGVNDANTAAWTKMRGEWKADTEKNVTAEDRGVAKQAAEKVFDKKTAEMIEAYGLTDHRGFVEAMVKIGKAIKDENFVAGNAAANGAASDARKHFPNSNMNP